MKRYFFCFMLLILAAACGHLRNGQIARVDYTYSGDFGASASRLSIYKRDGITYAWLDYNETKHSMVMVSPAEMDSFAVFVQQFKKLGKAGYCTSVVSCNVYTRDETIERESVPCSWEGFNSLMRLFSSEKGFPVK